MKRKLISALLVSAMTISLAACGTGGGSSDGGEGGGSGSSEGGHKLTVYAWDPAFNIPAIQAAADDYKENVDSEFELEILEQASSEDVETAITTAGSSGDYSNLPDIVLFQDHYIQRYVVTIRMHGHRSEMLTLTGMILQLRNWTTPQSTESTMEYL